MWWFWRGAVELHVLHHAAERELHGAWMAAELARHGYAISRERCSRPCTASATRAC